MTDNDIIKALKQCSRDYCHTSECPIFCGTTNEDCRHELIKSALDLINRQKAEIERLQKAIQVQEIMLGNQDNAIKKARAEAITELVDRFKNVVVSKYEYTDVRVFKDLDQIAKEMKEGVNNA
jgi:hypothetical protein